MGVKTEKWITPMVWGPLLASLVLVAPGRAQEAISVEMLREEIPQFSEIHENLYRGGQPTDRGLELLKELGIKTIINFRHESDNIENERKIVESLGLAYESIPWRIQMHPDGNVMQQFLQIVRQEKSGPFFIHCRRGAERTGVADALYRYYSEELSYEEAWKKSTKGFNTAFYWKPFAKRRFKSFLKELGPRPLNLESQ